MEQQKNEFQDVIIVLDNDNFPRYYKCPKCSNKMGACAEQHSYCEKCGQALNWENVGMY